jgi:radical SAM protein with 4Fe4S-binding SPASM domain
MQANKLKELKIEVTHQCSLACVHCSSDAHRDNNKVMSIDNCIKIIKSAAELGVEETSFSGGEPFCWDGLMKCVSMANDLNIKTIVYTSGNIENFNEKCFQLFNYGLKEVVFSLYSDDPQKHDRITRRNDSFNKTIRAIIEAKNIGLIVKVHFVVMKSNYQQLENIIKLCEIHGVTSLSILRFVPQGRGKMLNSSIMDQKDYLVLKNVIIRNRNRKTNIRTGSPLNFLMLNDNPICPAGVDRLIIGPDLNIFPCDAFKGYPFDVFFPNDKYSNLLNRSLQECWKKSEYLNFIRSEIEEYGEKCTKCPSFNFCRSGCLAQKRIIYGDFQKKPDPSCLFIGKASNE